MFVLQVRGMNGKWKLPLFPKIRATIAEVEQDGRALDQDGMWHKGAVRIMPCDAAGYIAKGAKPEATPPLLPPC